MDPIHAVLAIFHRPPQKRSPWRRPGSVLGFHAVATGDTRVADRSQGLADWLRNEFAEEQRAGFPRLKRVPDTRVIRFLDHFDTLSHIEQSQLTAVLAEWSSYRLAGTSLPLPIYEQFTRGTAFPGRAEGLRYTG